MAVLAQRIAEHAKQNFLYAFLVIEALRGTHVLAAMDDAAARGVPLPEGGLPGVYRDFLRRELWRDDRAWSTRFGPFSPRLPSPRTRASPLSSSGWWLAGWARSR